MEPGAIFGRYVIEDVLGEGGMGRVYRAKDTHLGRRVALKVLVAERGVEARWREAKARMLREARAAAAFEHPNAVAIYDLGEIDDAPYIAMELVAGRPLRAYVGDASVPWETKLRWMLDVGSALAAAHDAGLVHRDVKPENVLVTADGRAKVLDFGIARRGVDGPDPGPETAAALPTLTTAGLVVGTLAYMPPEQLAGDPIDARADQFAWAVTAYELLSGTMPWPSRNDVVAALTAKLTTPAVPLRDVAPFVPEEVARAVHTALARDRDARFASMRELVAAVAPFARSPGESRTSVPVRISSGPPADVHAKTEAIVAAPLVPATTGSSAPPRRVGRVLAAASVAAVALAATAFGAYRSGGARSPNGTAPAGSASTTAATASAVTAVPAAAAAFEEGMRAYRDSVVDPAIDAFERAVQLDPGLAAAHLRLGIFYAWFRRPTDAREAFARANTGRDRLSEHDRAELLAISPYVERAVPDFDEIHRRLADGLARFPDDGELLLLDGAIAWESGDPEGMLRAADRMIATKKPLFVEGYNFRGMALARLERYDDAVAALRACVAASPAASTCTSNLLDIHERLGDCDAAESDARAESAATPTSPMGYGWLASVLAGRERAEGAVVAALQQKWSRTPAQLRERTQASDEARLALWRGDFTTALARADHLEDLLASAGEQTDHAEAATLAVSALVESGKTAEAAKRAKDFLARKDGWMEQPWHEFVLLEDPTPVMLDAERRGGLLDAARFDGARTQWASRWREHAPQRLVPFVWFHAYASVAQTKDEARAALDARAAWEPMPSFHALREDFALGNVLLASGQGGAAAPLRAATRWCDALSEPIARTRAEASLGEALAQTGDKRAACEAYGRLLTRWGGARPRSVTADAVRVRARALGCR